VRANIEATSLTDDGSVAPATVGYHLPMPANREATLLAREVLDPPYFVLTFRHPEVAREARAGQFVMIKAGTSAEPPLRRPFSILAVEPETDSFRLFIKVIGSGTRALSAMAIGDVAQCLGPLGRPFTLPASGEEALLVAGGYGIAPFRLFSEALRQTGGRARVFYGGRTEKDLQIRDRFEPLGVPLVAATEDGSLGAKGRVTAPLTEYLDRQPGPVRLYACGPDAMLHAVARLAEARGLVAEVSVDPWMGCGIGTCLGCVVPTQGADDARPKLRCACTEGPVFDAVRLVWPGDKVSLARRRADAVTTVGVKHA
jgi:dihydroorotate dehydrogenase electron transfer subunit